MKEPIQSKDQAALNPAAIQGLPAMDGPKIPVLNDIDAARAKLGNCGRSLIYNLINAGKLKVTKIGARTFISDDEIARYIAESTAA